MEKRFIKISGILFVLFGVTYGNLFRQDYYFDHRAGGWLKFYPIPNDWNNAVLTCHNEGAILASPFDEDLSKALSTIMVDNRLKTAPMFTGISNIYEYSEYQSMEGVPISDLCIAWSVEPDVVKLTSEKNCIAMNANETLTAVSCSDRLPFACYGKSGIEHGKCGRDNEFVFNNLTGSCYKAHNKLFTWPEAFKTCAREGAHLAVINSDVEAEVLWKMAKEVIPKPPLSSLHSRDYINVGFRAWGEPAQRTWITIHGQSLDDAGYARWAPTEPNNIISESCGSLFAGGEVEDGVLNDAPCTNQNYKFICEIDLKIKASSN